MEQQNHNNPKAKTSVNDGRLTADSIHLNDLNRPLFNELSADGYHFTLLSYLDAKPWELHRCEDFEKTRRYIIKAYSTESNCEQLTHELLHVWMEQKGFSYYLEIYNYLDSSAKNTINDYIFPVTFNTSLAANQRFKAFNNMLAHATMLDKFVALGFEKSRFLYSSQSIEQKIEKFNNRETSFLMCYWHLRLIEKMETFSKEEIEILHKLLQVRSESWYEFSVIMYKSWVCEFLGVDNKGFYKKLVATYNRLTPS
jgi:hypothetical protein